jgi:hypothetical protein
MDHRTDEPKQPLLCVVHIPKTAGSAIRETLISILGWDKVYWISHKRPFEHWTNSNGDEFNNYAVVGGHCSTKTFDKIKRPKIFMAVVRDPVQRAVSLFNYITYGPDPNHGLRNELSGLSLVEAIQASATFRRDIENRQCALIGGQPMFSEALRSLCDSQWFIDRHEAVNQLFVRVCERFGWPAQPMVSDNVGREGYADAYLSDKKAITILKHLNEQDNLLVSIFDKNVVRRFHLRATGDLPSVGGASLADATYSGRLDLGSGLRENETLIAPAGPVTANGSTEMAAVDHNSEVKATLLKATEIGLDHLIRAAYRAVLGRSPDPSGLQTYTKLFKGASLSEGVERVVRGLLGSPEFQRKQAGRREESNAPPALPQICSFTPQGERWVATLGIRPDRVLVARFCPDPGSRPTIYLRDRSLLTIYRILHSVRYIDSLISNYLLSSDYFHTCFSSTIRDPRDLFCLYQIDDRTASIEKTVGYCGTGSKMTLIPDLQFWLCNGYFDRRQEFTKSWVSWKDRLPQVFWRGSSTGAEPITLDSFPHLPRFRLCAASVECTGLRGVLDAKFTDIAQARGEEVERIRASLSSLGLLSSRVRQVDFLKYRFQIDIDGNSNSWGFLPKLMMGSCVLKVMSEWRQWYYQGLHPWEHYVPVKNDLSDLEERIEWCLENDDAARQIGANGMKYANAIVFGPEMTRAARLVSEATQSSADLTF